jgi:hypothetical protein
MQIRCRIERLERRQKGSPNAHDLIVQAALGRVSLEDLTVLAADIKAFEQGRPVSSAYPSVTERVSALVEEERVRAGFESVFEFEELFPQTDPNQSR